MSDQVNGSESENPAVDAPTPKAHRPRTNKDWWPDQLDLSVLRRHAPTTNALGDGFDYAAEFATVDVEELKQDIVDVMHDSKDWWPADWGHYGPLFIRMTWHAAGTYRIADGRGGGGEGAQRFAPLNSWPDNVSLDKARRLLWPVKQKYGRKLSWADLIIFAGNVAIEDMGLPTFGFGFGRPDLWEPDEIFWGPEDEWLGDARYSGERELSGPLGAVQMGLIYVNPEGPNGVASALAAARDIRETFGRMAMNDEETAALIVGGHTFGKAHGAHDADLLGPEPEGCPVEAQGLGWANPSGTGSGPDTVTSGLEGAWTSAPTRWDNGFLENLYKYDWDLTISPAGAQQWTPTDPKAKDDVPDAHIEGKRNAPIMFTTDLALRYDPIYGEITRRWLDHPEELSEAFAKAWYKLLHRDMGPVSRFLGPLVAEPQLWQDPVPAVDHDLIDEADITALKDTLLSSGLSSAQLIRTAWASAATFRGTDKRGGANGARIRLAPQKGWAVNEPAELATVLQTLEGVQEEFNGSQSGGTRVSLADLIVLGGCAAIEKAARDAGHDVVVPFSPGRTDATDEMTDVETFDVLEPRADGFRNYVAPGEKMSPEKLLLERSFMLNLTPTEMTALVGGLRSLGITAPGTSCGVFTDRAGQLTNDFFVNLLAAGTEWKVSTQENVYEGRDAATGEVRWTATAADLVFGSHAQLRGISEVYGADDGEQALVRDFVASWTKVMELDRFDLR